MGSVMTDAAESLVIEPLRHIRGRADRIAEDMTELKQRLSSVETSMTLVKREIAAGDETDARQQVDLDRVIERLDRIERRLDLVEK